MSAKPLMVLQDELEPVLGWMYGLPTEVQCLLVVGFFLAIGTVVFYLLEDHYVSQSHSRIVVLAQTISNCQHNITWLFSYSTVSAACSSNSLGVVSRLWTPSTSQSSRSLQLVTETSHPGT